MKMKKTNQISKKTNIVTLMRMDAKACNKYLTDDFLNKQTPETLLRLCHPLNRSHYYNYVANM